MKSISRFEAAEPLSAHNILCGTLPPPDRRDEHPFVPLITYLDVRCPEQPHGWNATADVFFDDILAGLLGSACGIREALQRGTMDLAAARIAVETLRKRCIAHGERLDACNVFAEHDDVEKAVTDTARLRAHCDVGLTGCGDLTALARLAEMGETCILLRADGFV